MNIEKLRKKQEDLWANVQATEKIFQAARDEWHPIYKQLQEAELRAEMKAKIMDEIAKESKQD